MFELNSIRINRCVLKYFLDIFLTVSALTQCVRKLKASKKYFIVDNDGRTIVEPYTYFRNEPSLLNDKTAFTSYVASQKV